MGRYKIKEDRRRLRKEYEKLKNENKSLNNKIQELKFEISDSAIKDIKNKPTIDNTSKSSNRNLITETEGIKDELSPTLSVYEGGSKNEFNSKDNNSNEKDILTDVFYLGFPDSESVFYAPEATSKPNEESFYEIRNDELFLHDNIQPARMQMAMNFVENHVKRVCVIQNSREQHHNKIKMVEPGKVERHEDDYRITEKMIVRYE